ncbi:MAG: hypothetical protein WA886_10450, partial [Candidatus Acidiferrales bacterium]
QTRRLLTQFFYATSGWMNPHQQIIERKISVPGNHDLAVQDKLTRSKGDERAGQFRKVSRERLSGLGF